MTLAAYQAASVALDTYFCNSFEGRDKTALEYQYVVEGRDAPSSYAHYSSCGDRPAAKYFRLGCRSSFINRKEHKGWRVGANISSLAYGCPLARQPNKDWVPSPGDELLIWNKSDGTDAHSLAIIEYKANERRAITANYGSSGMSARSFPGCKFADVPLVFNGVLWKCGEPGHAKTVYRVLRLEAMIPLFTDPPNLTYIDGDMLPEMSRAYDEIMAAREASAQ